MSNEWTRATPSYALPSMSNSPPFTPPRAPSGDPQPFHNYLDSRPEATMVTVSQRIGAVPAADFSWRAPSPPHIHVPQAPEDQQIVLPPWNGFANSPAEKEILRRATEGDNRANGYREWTYEWRRKAQKILSFLYLGPSSAAKDTEFIQKEGITLLLVIRNTATAAARLLGGERVAQQLGIQTCCIDVSGNQELIAAFPRAINAINSHLISAYMHFSNNFVNATPARGKVLVFCESGNERSAAVVAAYIMTNYNQELVTTLQYIQSHRFCVAFDDSMKNLLSSHKQIVDASRAVVNNPNTGGMRMANGTRAKRGSDSLRDGDDDGDVDMDHQDDRARFEGRTQFAPYRDNV
ncbi:hypothetical protein G7Y89_g3654 [Cudoniella acicularis]|uniref:Tyrosine specific protein phosphatases domain-containing protein n=1 Tax=Cudoniella acicularis TaxID=354080 RepID=A0A8H4RTX6_9HELO|nr:hypothetical protein G7Y89_g3654 [Cudoniella acicularis]